jgi:hypothetical protein
MGPLDIGWAVEQLRQGEKVTRMGWNGQGQVLSMVALPASFPGMERPYVCIRTVQGDWVPWTCSQTDLLATDWVLA